MRQLFFLLICLTAAFCGCKEKRKKPIQSVQTVNFIRQGRADTLLKSGWTVQYLVKDDSTKYKDIYIKWVKGNKSGVYYGPDLLELKNEFMPEFAGENEEYIFMGHSCSTNCLGLLILSKDKLVAKDFTSIKAFDISTNRVVWLPAEDFQNVGGLFKVIITDLNQNKDSLIVFKNLALGSFQEGYIDTVLFSQNTTKIKCTLVDRNDYNRNRKISEVQIVRQ